MTETNAPYALAVKALIVNTAKNQILLVKRRLKDVHSPGVWEVPGGRLVTGEDPFDGLKRETREEAGLEIEIHQPLDVRHFTRDDGQQITLIIFLCSPFTNDIALSEEHTEYEWVHAEEAKERIHPSFLSAIAVWEKHYR
ncbi:MAG: NUDIX domain-containing protein [bacterium]|nr:NUDIX domain-containing protein [bacterium]